MRMVLNFPYHPPVSPTLPVTISDQKLFSRAEAGIGGDQNHSPAKIPCKFAVNGNCAPKTGSQ